jgi:hypothetical protein
MFSSEVLYEVPSEVPSECTTTLPFHYHICVSGGEGYDVLNVYLVLGDIGCNSLDFLVRSVQKCPEMSSRHTRLHVENVHLTLSETASNNYGM